MAMFNLAFAPRLRMRSQLWTTPEAAGIEIMKSEVNDRNEWNNYTSN